MKLGDSKQIIESACTACGKTLDSAACVGEDAMPTEGDITLCIGCGHLMAFDQDLKLRELTAQEMKMIAGDQRLLAASKAMHAMKHGE